MKIIMLLIVISFLAISGCYYDSQEFLYPQPSNSCDTINVTFTESVKPILENSCLSCHSNSTAASYGGGTKLQDYADVKLKVDDGKLVGTIKWQSGFSQMPKGTSQLEDCKITIIEKWISASAPNN